MKTITEQYEQAATNWLSKADSAFSIQDKEDLLVMSRESQRIADILKANPGREQEVLLVLLKA